jgi:hypothetical protein
MKNRKHKAQRDNEIGHTVYGSIVYRALLLHDINDNVSGENDLGHSQGFRVMQGT